jgi:hypothetical protein
MSVLVAATIAATSLAAVPAAQAVTRTPVVVFSGGPTLRINVNPDLAGKAAWSFTLQRRTARGAWAKVGSYATLGSTEIQSLPVAAGTYRVAVAARAGFRATLSAAYAYVPKPLVRVRAGQVAHVDVDPNLPGTQSWGVTVQRLVGKVWKKVGTYRTVGTAETLDLRLPTGIYRYLTAAQGRFPAAVSPAARYVVPPPPAPIVDPSAPGTYAVTRTTTTVGSTAVTVFSPARATGTAPVLVLLPGFEEHVAAYDATGAAVAAHGYAVLVADVYPIVGTTDAVAQSAAVSVITWGSSAANLPVADPTRIAVAGHGGAGKLAVVVALADTRVRAVFGIDPVDSANAPNAAVLPSAIAALTVPAAFMGETLDGTGLFQPCAPLASNYAVFYADATAAPVALNWTVAGAGLASFTDVPTVADTFCKTPTADRATVLAALRLELVAFMARYLQGDTLQDQWLVGAALPSILTAAHRP